MRRLDIVRRAGKNLRQAKGRTLLTSLAIAVGAFTLTMSLAAGEGARKYADNLLKNNIDPQALFIVKDKSLTESGGTSGIREYSDDLGAASRQGATVKMMTKEDIKKLEQEKDLTNVVPTYQLAPKFIQVAGNAKKYSAPASYYDATIMSTPKTGTLPPLGEQIKDNEVIVPEEFLDTLGVSADALVGKTLTITMMQSAPSSVDKDKIQQALMTGGDAAVSQLLAPKEKQFVFTVRAVTKKPAMSIASSPKLNVSTNAARQLSDYATEGTAQSAKYIGATALAKKGIDASNVKNALEDKYGYSVQTAKDAQNLLFTFVNILQGIVGGFGLLALLASIFGIINTQYISVLERTSQIGLMKALGMRGADIGKLFRYEAAWIGLIGGIMGAGLAVALGLLMNPWITEKLSLGAGFSLLSFVWWQVAILLVVLVLVGIVAGWFPSRKAAKLDPIEALRTE